MVQAVQPEAADTALSGARRTADLAYCYLTGLFVIGILVQIFLAGVGVFGINASKVQNASSFDLHRNFGEILGLVSIIILILALVARFSRRTVFEAVGLVLLVEVAQHGLAAAGDNDKWIGGLHALDGVVIMLLSVAMYFAARQRSNLP
jgi:hypothetical protein